MRNPLLTPLLGWFGRLSYPKLFLLTAGLFVVDLVVPDVIPLVDEILLGLGTLLIANFKQRNAPDPRAPIDGDATRR